MTKLYTIRYREDLGGAFAGAQWARDANEAVTLFCGRHVETDSDLYDAALEGCEESDGTDARDTRHYGSVERSDRDDESVP
jgi:hypothetical protein